MNQELKRTYLLHSKDARQSSHAWFISPCFLFFFFLSLYFTSQGSTIQATYIFLLRLLLDANTNCKKSGGGPAWYKVLMLVDPFCDRWTHLFPNPNLETVCCAALKPKKRTWTNPGVLLRLNRGDLLIRLKSMLCGQWQRHVKVRVVLVKDGVIPRPPWPWKKKIEYPLKKFLATPSIVFYANKIKFCSIIFYTFKQKEKAQKKKKN